MNPLYPPTPTPLPPGDPLFTLPSDYGLWGAAPTAIQVWNWAGPLGTIIQTVILVALILAGVYVFYRFLQGFTQRDAQE